MRVRSRHTVIMMYSVVLSVFVVGAVLWCFMY
jgi:hypothetical protein